MPLNVQELITVKSEKSSDCVFVETGSYLGDGVQSAIEVGFHRVYSIEAYKPLYDHCSKRFRNEPSVKLHYGSSRFDLYELCKNIETDIVFWLDAHYSGTGTGKEDSSERPNCPVYEELDQIKRLSKNTHTIMIDDMVLVSDKSHDIQFGVDQETIIAKIKEINPDYIIRFVDGHRPNDILIASVHT